MLTTPAGAWLVLGTYHSSDVDYWKGSNGSTVAAWSPLSNSPYDSEFAFGDVGDTLMLTGASCAGVSGCTRSFVVQRYSISSLSPTGDQIVLSQDLQGSNPAMAGVGGNIALLWTETQSPGELFRTLINEDGTFALAIGTVQSAIQPKTIVQSADGGALLIGTIAAGSPIMYQLVGQRLDANLGFLGNPIPLADSENSDATSFETHLSSDGSQVLITYRQAGAKCPRENNGAVQGHLGGKSGSRGCPIGSVIRARALSIG